jgi:hypothetical protein
VGSEACVPIADEEFIFAKCLLELGELGRMGHSCFFAVLQFHQQMD